MDLQFLLDKHLIEESFAVYGRLVDEKRFGELDRVFTRDVVMVVPHPISFTLNGLDAVIASMVQRLGPNADCAITHHNMTNLNLRVDGDRAQSRANYVAWHGGRNAFEGKVYLMAGHYDDRWLRTADGWRVAHRTFEVVITDGNGGMMWAGG